jgi:predicted transcriptional regulator
MSKAMSVRLPKYLHREIKKLAEEEGISMNQFIATAAAEKISSLKTVEYLEERAERGSREKFEQVLSKVSDTEPEERDKL